MGNRYDVQNYYAASSILIHSSPAEGLPTVILEAMHFGIPVVATNSLPGVPEILEGTQDGLVCPVGDAEKMAEYLYDLITQPELYKKYSQRGKKRIKDFEPENIQKELLEFLYRIKDNKS